MKILKYVPCSKFQNAWTTFHLKQTKIICISLSGVIVFLKKQSLYYMHIGLITTRVLWHTINFLKISCICYEMAVHTIAHTNHVHSRCSKAPCQIYRNTIKFTDIIIWMLSAAAEWGLLLIKEIDSSKTWDMHAEYILEDPCQV